MANIDVKYSKGDKVWIPARVDKRGEENGGLYNKTMGIYDMNEKKDRIKALEEEFWKRMDSIKESKNSMVLDNGKTETAKVFDWFKTECDKLFNR